MIPSIPHTTRSASSPLPAPRRIHWRCSACWIVFAIVVLITLSFATLDMRWKAFFSLDSLHRMGRFLGELLSPAVDVNFVKRLGVASLETLAMSALGTLLAAFGGLLLALPASRTHADDQVRWRGVTRLILNVLRSVPELAWAALLLIAAGLGPFAGTLALAFHTAGVLGRLFSESIENTPPEAAWALRVSGVSEGRIFFYATLPAVLPQLLSYSLYRWENNIRAAAVLGVVGAGGLGQMLAFHMGLFQMSETSSILIAMLVLVVLVDLFSYIARRLLAR